MDQSGIKEMQRILRASTSGAPASQKRIIDKTGQTQLVEARIQYQLAEVQYGDMIDDLKEVAAGSQMVDPATGNLVDRFELYEKDVIRYFWPLTRNELLIEPKALEQGQYIRFGRGQVNDHSKDEDKAFYETSLWPRMQQALQDQETLSLYGRRVLREAPAVEAVYTDAFDRLKEAEAYAASWPERKLAEERRAATIAQQKRDAEIAAARAEKLRQKLERKDAWAAKRAAQIATLKTVAKGTISLSGQLTLRAADRGGKKAVQISTVALDAGRRKAEELKPVLREATLKAAERITTTAIDVGAIAYEQGKKSAEELSPIVKDIKEAAVEIGREAKAKAGTELAVASVKARHYSMRNPLTVMLAGSASVVALVNAPKLMDGTVGFLNTMAAVSHGVKSVVTPEEPFLPEEAPSGTLLDKDDFAEAREIKPVNPEDLQDAEDYFNQFRFAPGQSKIRSRYETAKGNLEELRKLRNRQPNDKELEAAYQRAEQRVARLPAPKLNDKAAVLAAAKYAGLLLEGRLNGALQSKSATELASIITTVTRMESIFTSTARASGKSNRASGATQMQPDSLVDAALVRLRDELPDYENLFPELAAFERRICKKAGLDCRTASKAARRRAYLMQTYKLEWYQSGKGKKTWRFAKDKKGRKIVANPQNQEELGKLLVSQRMVYINGEAVPQGALLAAIAAGLHADREQEFKRHILKRYGRDAALYACHLLGDFGCKKMFSDQLFNARATDKYQKHWQEYRRRFNWMARPNKHLMLHTATNNRGERSSRLNNGPELMAAIVRYMKGAPEASATFMQAYVGSDYGRKIEFSYDPSHRFKPPNAWIQTDPSDNTIRLRRRGDAPGPVMPNSPLNRVASASPAP